MEISERVRAVFREAARAAAPPPDIGITAWAEANRILGHSSRLSEPYRVVRTPYWREVMDAVSPRSGVQNRGPDAKYDDTARELVHNRQHPMRSQAQRFTTKQVGAPQTV